MVRRAQPAGAPSSSISTRERMKFVCRFIRLLPAIAAIVAALSLPAQARSSGGYSRPSFSGSSGSHSSSFGTSHQSGGYVRPSLSGGFEHRSTPSFSAGDRAVSRRSSQDALSQFRTRQRPSAPEFQPRRPSLAAPPARDDGYTGFTGRPSFEPSYRSPAAYDWGWHPPTYIRPTESSYHGWNPFLFWFLLDRLAQSGSTEFFHHHEYDPGYAEWRASAEQAGRDNADLREKLKSLDAALAAKRSDPRDPGYLPDGVSPASAHARADIAEPTDRPSGRRGGRMLFFVIVALVAAVVFLFYVSARHSASAARYAAISGGAKGNSMEGLKAAGNFLRQKLSKAPAGPLKPFRVGMALTIDPTPFILAQGATKVPAPKAQGSTAFASVKAIGTIEGTPLYRLHLDDSTFVQIHLDGERPDECRYFAQIDEVTPADAEEWKAWLEPSQGMIGWPQFQTKDQKLYDRVWSPGANWVEPVGYVEKFDAAQPSGSVRGVMMLYGAATGLADPAPQTEYILVASVESESKGAWVAVYAGIDVNPAGLSLS